MPSTVRLIALASLLLAGCSTLPQRHDARVSKGEHLWNGLTPAASVEQVPDEEIHLSQLLEHEEPNATACRKHRAGLAHYLERVPVDLGMWRMAEHCAGLTGDTAGQSRARENIDALVAYAFRDGQSTEPWWPASVLHAWDIPELAAERGFEIKWMRVLSLDSLRHLLVEASMVDAQGRENRYYFDLLDAILRLSVDDPAQVYPADRRNLAFAALEADAIAGDPLALTGYLYMDLESGELHPVPARRALQHAWEGGEAGGGLMLMEMCLTNDELACDPALMQSVTDDLIERDIAEGHVFEAAMLIRAGRSHEDSDVLAAMDRAAALSDRGRMLYYLADVLSEAHGSLPGERAALVEELFQHSASLDNGAAALRLATNAIAASADDTPLDASVEAHLEHAARQGLPLALHLKGRLIAEDPQQRMSLLYRAAELGLPEAQFLLGLFLASGDNTEQEQKAEAWLNEAADGGSLIAMRALAQRRLRGIAGDADPAAAAAWLFSAWNFGDTEAAAWMIALYALHPELNPESDTPALELAGLVGPEADREQIAMQIDRVFRQVPPFDDHPETAGSLLEGLSAEGWAAASLILGERALEGADEDEGFEEARCWYLQAITQGSVEAHYQLANHLLQDIGDVPAAIEALRDGAESGHVSATNDLAYLLCTGEQGAERDPADGLTIIERLFERTDQQHPYHYSTLAACQAANGDFEAALRNHDIALTRTRQEQPDAVDVHDQMRHRLELYQAGRPYIWSEMTDG